MHHCPSCNQAFGPLPGVPVGVHEPFTADVRCPECAQVVRAGTRLLVGATRVEAVGHVGTGRRIRMALLTALPGILILNGGIRGALKLKSPLDTVAIVQGILGLAALFFVGNMLWRAWQRWGRGGGEDARPDVAWELQWLVSAGRLEVLDHAKAASAAHTLATVPAAKSIVIEAARVRAIRAEVPKQKIRGADGAPRSGVQLVLEVWKRGWRGDRAGLESLKVCVDAGRPDDTPGLDQTEAVQADGDRLANAVFTTLTGEPVGAVGGVISLRGHPDAATAWPDSARRRRLVAVVVSILLFIPFFMFAFLAATELGLAGGWLALALVGIVGLWISMLMGLLWLLTRGVLRRELTRCAWNVGPEGVLVTESRQRSMRAEAEGFARLVAARDVADVQCVEASRRPRIRLLDRAGRELAAITPDTLPADGREATRAMLRTALGLEGSGV